MPSCRRIKGKKRGSDMDEVGCSPCRELDINIPAIRLCVTCSKPMCVRCADLHQSSFVTSSHQIEFMTTGKSDKVHLQLHYSNGFKLPDGKPFVAVPYWTEINAIKTDGKQVYGASVRRITGSQDIGDDYKSNAGASAEAIDLSGCGEAKRSKCILAGSKPRTNKTLEQTVDIPAHIKEDTAKVSNDKDVSVQKHVLKSSFDNNDKEESKMSRDDIEATVNDVKSNAVVDIRKVIAYCEDSVTSLDRITTTGDVQKQNVKETYQTLRKEALRIINESEVRAMEKANRIVEENREIIGCKKRELEEILKTTRRINSDLEVNKNVNDVGDLDSLKQSVLKTQSSIERLRAIGKAGVFYKCFHIMPSQTSGTFNIKLCTQHIPLTMKPLPAIQSTSNDMKILADYVTDTLRVSYTSSSTVCRGMSKASTKQINIQMTRERNNSPTEECYQSYGSDELNDDELVVESLTTKHVDKQKRKPDPFAGKAKLQIKTPVKERQIDHIEAIVDFEHVLTKEVVTPDNRKPSVNDIKALSGGQVVVSDSKNSRIIFLTEGLDYKTEIGLKYAPGKLAELNDQTLLVCLRRTNKLAIIATPENSEPKTMDYVEMAYHPQCILVVDSETIWVSMKDHLEEWHFTEMKKGHFSAFIETRDMQHTFRSGYNLGLLRRGASLETCCVLQCCADTNAMYSYDHEGYGVFQYCVEHPRQCATDRFGNIYLLTHINGIYVLNDCGSLVNCFSTPTLRGTSCFTINADQTKIVTLKFKNASVTVYRIIRH